MLFFLRLFFSLCILFSSAAYPTQIYLTVHEAGQGNCVTVRFQGKKPDSKPEFIVVDAGSTGFHKAHAYTQAKIKESQEEGIPVQSSPSAVPSDFSQVVGEGANTEIEEDTSHIFNIRKSFVDGDQEAAENPIHIKTVVITHPDRDHYNWIHCIFSNEADRVDHIILGGLPQHYHLEENNHYFTTWVSSRLKNQSLIYFPAINHDPVNSLQGLAEILECSKERKYAEDQHSEGNSLKVFDKAFHFGKNVVIDLLSTCPTHESQEGKIIRPSVDPKDDNDDSLVLKITNNNNSSALLTGDATGKTIERIRKNYAHNPAFLKVDVFLACHHGSITHSSHQFEGAEFKYAFISAGHSEQYKHPREEAVQTLKESKSLETTQPHELLTFKSSEKGKDAESIQIIEEGCYSTLSHGNLMAELPSNGPVTISTAREGEIEPTSSHSKELKQRAKDTKKRKHGSSLLTDKKELCSFEETKEESEEEQEETRKEKKKRKKQKMDEAPQQLEEKSKGIGPRRSKRLQEKKEKVTEKKEDNPSAKRKAKSTDKKGRGHIS